MSSLKFTKHGYKIQAEKRMKEENGVGYALRRIVQMENMLVMNETQFRWFYEKFSGHQLIGGDNDDLNCLKLSLLKDLLNNICSNIDERGIFHYEEEKEEIADQSVSV